MTTEPISLTPPAERYSDARSLVRPQGRAREVLEVGDLPDPEPGPGEVRIRVSASGINPGDVGKRWGTPGAPMPFPRVIPHSDGAGVIDAVGSGVDEQRLGERVWCYGAQSYRPFGTAAEYCVVPDALAVGLPDDADSHLLDQAACLGIAGITGYRALLADGPLHGLTVLVYGAAGGVGSIAVQLAVRAGARVIGIVRTPRNGTSCAVSAPTRCSSPEVSTFSTMSARRPRTGSTGSPRSTSPGTSSSTP
ncbi:alcohol dehydrogenase catalytic domain-containing protein [Streptomyces umbrinus]|uniref:alcohol dehydrogenase catalytic domain-containing protein n=1 Tax=Streptomyces umbrinus TaxID=67370 RepID=UPI0034008217